MHRAKPGILRGRRKRQPVSLPIIKTVSASPASLPWGTFLLTWLGAFSLIFMLLYGAGLIPEGVGEIERLAMSLFAPAPTVRRDTAAPAENADTSNLAQKEPRLVIPAINLRALLLLPKSRDVNVLNNALAEGPIYYPGSALPGETGNLFILGHSSFLPVVHNPAYKIFNGVKDLKQGDTIHVAAGSREYLYIVTSVEKKLADDAKIDLATTEKLLTISTCNVFGGKESRFVIRAKFLRSYPLRTLAVSPERPQTFWAESTRTRFFRMRPETRLCKMPHREFSERWRRIRRRSKDRDSST